VPFDYEYFENIVGKIRLQKTIFDRNSRDAMAGEERLLMYLDHPHGLALVGNRKILFREPLDIHRVADGRRRCREGLDEGAILGYDATIFDDYFYLEIFKGRKVKIEEVYFLITFGVQITIF